MVPVARPGDRSSLPIPIGYEVAGRLTALGPGTEIASGGGAVGDEVLATRADNTVAVFTVSDSDQYPKNAFPADEVYAPDLAPSLRLITCGGAFDRGTRDYLDNVIVFATPA